MLRDGPASGRAEFPRRVRSVQEAPCYSKRAWPVQSKVLRGRGGSEGAGRRPRRLQLGAGSERGGVLGRGLKGQGLVIGLGSHLARWKGPGTLEPQTGVRPQPLGSSVGPDPGE